MASTSEVGHAKNLANIDKVIDLITQFGATYNPTNPQITLSGITTLKASCSAVAATLTTTFVTYKNDTNIRQTAFKPIDKLVTSILDNVKTLGVDQQTIDDVSAIVKKIHGDSTVVQAGDPTAKTVSTTPPTIPVVTPATPVTISTSQQSYDSILSNFNKLIQLLITITSYAPNEANIQTATLTALNTTLGTANLTAITATNAYNLARNQRNLNFYAPNTGLCDIMKKVKAYTRQVYGSQSSEYHQMTAIKFVSFKTKKKSKKKTK